MAPGAGFRAHNEDRIGVEDEGVWKKDLRLRWVVEAVVTGVVDYADDLQPVVGLVGEDETRIVDFEGGAAHVLPKGIAVGKVLLDEGSVDQNNVSRAGVFFRREETTSDERHL